MALHGHVMCFTSMDDASDPFLPGPSHCGPPKALRVKSGRRIGPKFVRTGDLILNATDAVWLMVLTSLSIFIHVFRIQYPRKMLDHEEQWLAGINKYMSGMYFSPSEGPLSYQIMFGFAYLLGYDGKMTSKDGEFSAMYYVSLRITCALIGAIGAPMTYLALRFMNVGCGTASIGGLLVALDLFLIASSRILSGHGLAHCAACVALMAISAFDACQTLGTFVFEGVTIGAAIACDTRCVVILVCAALRLVRVKDAVYKIGILGALSLLVVLVTWFFHFVYLPLTDSTSDCPKGLEPFLVAAKEGTWCRHYSYWDIPRILMSVMMHRPKNASSGSDPNVWGYPLAVMKCHAIFSEANERKIGLMGNPLTWVPAFIAIALSGFQGFQEVKKEVTWEASMVIGYVLSYVTCGEASDFYLCVIIGLMLLAKMIDEIPPKARGFAKTALVTCVFFGFWFWSPVCYGFYVAEWEFLTGRTWIEIL